MTTIRPGTPNSIYPRLADTGGRIPFGLIDNNGNGQVSKTELHIALQRIFPSLSDAQCKSIAGQAFSSLGAQGMTMDRNGWAVAEEVVLQSAKACDSANAMQTGNAPSGWLNETGARPQVPMVMGQGAVPLPPSNMYQPNVYTPRNDYAVTGYNPYQYPMGMPGQIFPNMPGLDTPGTKMAKGAGRGLLGFLKMIPVVGNVINGIDFIRDIGKSFTTFGNPTKTFGEKLKAGADLLFHGAGMIVPQIGGSYDIAQGAVRVAGGAVQSMTQPWNQLPQWQYNNGGYQNQYNMQYTQPFQNNPFSYGQFSNYSQYPQYPVDPYFQPPYLGPVYQQSYPQLPYGYNQGYSNYDPFSGSQWGYNSNPYAYNPQFGTPQDGLRGLGRMAIGAVKMAPGLGNILNGVDFVRDIGKMARGFNDPSTSFMKSASDLLFHGIGMIVPQVGASYDMAQGSVRAGAAGMGYGSYGGNPYYYNQLPMWNAPVSNIPSVYPGYIH